MAANPLEEGSALSGALSRREETFQHKLEQFNPGMVWLDSENRVTAFNDVAAQILGPTAEQSFGIGRGTLVGLDVLQLHPEKSREKLRFLLRSDSAGECPVKSPPPMAMMINIPDRVLMIKVSKMIGSDGLCGTCMVFYDMTDLTTRPVARGDARADQPRRLFKIPVYRKNRVVLVDVEEVIRFEGDGHYTIITTRDDRFTSNLSLSDLEARLDPEVYPRVHRSHIINLQFAVEFVRGDDSVSVIMADASSTAVPVSRSRAAQLKEMLGIT
ncbi:MAG: LytTR family transcriptional regulator [Rhodocyclaceae bacterium]|jgi:hypothetical protein|nr:LytTR family transcriptional regulator [Rhodocyclaceae bacterium]